MEYERTESGITVPKTLSPEDYLLDTRWFLENCVKIKTKSGGLEPFILNRPQLHIANLMRRQRRIVTCKARQLGSSTFVIGKIFHHAITTPGTTSAIIAHTGKAATELLDKIKTMWRTCPEEIRPEYGMNSKFEMSFPKMESKIVVLPATEELGRSYTFNGITLASELPFWPKAEEQMAALLPSIPDTATLVIESSPNMAGDTFHKFWCDDNGYYKLMLGWWWLYSEEQMAKVRREYNDDSRFFREYCCQFLQSGSSVFDSGIIASVRETVRRPGDKMTGEEGFDWKVQVVDGLKVKGCQPANGLVVFRPPTVNGIYVASGDVAAGYEEGDYSACTIFDRRTGEQVAFYRGHVAPTRFAEMLYAFGMYYNNAMLIPEVNNHGYNVLERLKQLGYWNLYYRPVGMETPGEKISDRLGWKTGPSTRSFLINEYKSAVKNGHLVIHSHEIYNEMTTFVYDKYGREDHLSGFHDDAVFSAAIAFQAFKAIWTDVPPDLDYREFRPQFGY
jgi:hypothetical protein